MKTVTIYEDKAVRITANVNDFDGDVDKWVEAFYILWRYQMTWQFAYRIDLIDGRNGVFVDTLIKPAYKKSLMDTMADLGYKNITAYEVPIGYIECTDTDAEHIEINW